MCNNKDEIVVLHSMLFSNISIEIRYHMVHVPISLSTLMAHNFIWAHIFMKKENIFAVSFSGTFSIASLKIHWPPSNGFEFYSSKRVEIRLWNGTQVRQQQNHHRTTYTVQCGIAEVDCNIWNLIEKQKKTKHSKREKECSFSVLISSLMSEAIENILLIFRWSFTSHSLAEKKIIKLFFIFLCIVSWVTSFTISIIIMYHDTIHHEQ